MRKHLAQNGWLYLLAGLLMTGLKFHYSTAESRGLLWILEPTARLVSLFTETGFSFVETEGFVSSTGGIVIAPACAGVNFLMMCFGMLVFSSLHRFRHPAAKVAWLFVSGLVSLLFTLLVNTMRIILSMNSNALPEASGWLTPERIHRMEGICVYFLALSALYFLAEALLTRLSPSRTPAANHGAPSRFRFLVPFFWYLAVTVGIPLARGSFDGNVHRFIEHSGTVFLLPVLFLTTFMALKYLVSRLLQASSFHIAVMCSSVLFIIMLFDAWAPTPVTATSFDTRHNGLWAGSKWYTGFDADTGKPVHPGEMESLRTLLTTNRIKYVYVRAGRISPSGHVEHIPGPVFFELKNRMPEVVFLPWLSGHASELPLQDPEWRNRVIQSLGRLSAAGVTGIHLNIEPIRNEHPGYVELLRGIRDRFDGTFFISHATCRVAPVGLIGSVMPRYFWSPEFYRATMRAADQTVLMGYNTTLWSRKMYCSYMKKQTQTLLECASKVPRHQVLIGIPSYDRASFLFDPLVENMVSASLGIRAALEEMPSLPQAFKGVAIYANWTTSPEEWQQFRENWLMEEFVQTISSRPNVPTQTRGL
jgi:exosortase K